MSSGLLGVDGGLMREGEETPASLPVLRSSRSLKLRLSELCLKKPGLEESWREQAKKSEIKIYMYITQNYILFCS